MRSSVFSVAAMFATATIAVAASEGSVANPNCLELTTPLWKETIGNANFPFNPDAIEITSQDIDTVSFKVNQLWAEGGTPFVAVKYRTDAEDTCAMESNGKGLVEFGTSMEYKADCSHGYAEIGVYFYAGDAEGVIVEECESCAAPDDNYVGYYVSLQCVPVCEPGTPDCIMEPTIVMADVGHEATCLYDSNPLVATEYMNYPGYGDIVKFKLKNTWSGSSSATIEQVAVSYDCVTGSPRCDTFQFDDFEETEEFMALCGDEKYTSVFVHIHSTSFEHTASYISDVCMENPKPDPLVVEGSCTYEIVFPCHEEVTCEEEPEETTTTPPTASPTLAHSNDPTSSPSSKPTTSPSS